MSKSVREMAYKVADGTATVRCITLSGDTDWKAQLRQVVDALERDGLLATPALLECGDACIAHFKQHPDSDRLGRKPTEACSMSTKAGRALLAEREGKPTPVMDWVKSPDIQLDPPTPSTAEVDARLYEALSVGFPSHWWQGAAVQFGGDYEGIRLAYAACRKAREKKPRYRVLHAAYANKPHPWAVLDGPSESAPAVAWCRTEAQARAVADALNALEAK